MASWKKTIKKLFNPQQQPRDKKSQLQAYDNRIITDLQGDVMACGYEDVQVMWSILDKSRPMPCTITS